MYGKSTKQEPSIAPAMLPGFGAQHLNTIKKTTTAEGILVPWAGYVPTFSVPF